MNLFLIPITGGSYSAAQFPFDLAEPFHHSKINFFYSAFRRGCTRDRWICTFALRWQLMLNSSLGTLDENEISALNQNERCHSIDCDERQTLILFRFAVQIYLKKIIDGVNGFFIFVFILSFMAFRSGCSKQRLLTLTRRWI